MLEKVFIKSENLVTRKIAGETMIVPVRNQVGDLNSIFTLNEVGARVWDLVDGQRSLSKVTEVITDEYEINPSIAEQDIQELVTDWERQGLVRQVAV